MGSVRIRKTEKNLCCLAMLCKTQGQANVERGCILHWPHTSCRSSKRQSSALPGSKSTNVPNPSALALLWQGNDSLGVLRHHTDDKDIDLFCKYEQNSEAVLSILPQHLANSLLWSRSTAGTGETHKKGQARATYGHHYTSGESTGLMVHTLQKNRLFSRKQGSLKGFMSKKDLLPCWPGCAGGHPPVAAVVINLYW